MISAFVTRTEHRVHRSYQQRCVCHRVGAEQARLCGEGGLGTCPGATEASSDPPMCCCASLFPQHNAKHLLGLIIVLKVVVETASASIRKLYWARERGVTLAGFSECRDSCSHFLYLEIHTAHRFISIQAQAHLCIIVNQNFLHCPPKTIC